MEANKRIATPPPVVNDAEKGERLLLVVVDPATRRELDCTPLVSWVEGVVERDYLAARFPHLRVSIERERGPPLNSRYLIQRIRRKFHLRPDENLRWEPYDVATSYPEAREKCESGDKGFIHRLRRLPGIRR